ncbi:MAG: hypothetical protein GXO29_06695 [Thermotogae bacterium]|nr:hypothetical protein [Thermotogota bacterium]
MVALILSTFADSLLAEGDLFNAITEYKRMLYEGRGDSSLILLRVGYAHYLRRKYDRAAYYFSLAREYVPEAKYLQAASLILGRDREVALEILEGDTSGTAKLLRGLAFIALGRYARAEAVFDSLGYRPPIRGNREIYIAASYLLPGSGHLLIGRYSEGLKTFAANLLSFAGAYYLLKRGLYYDLLMYVPIVLLRFYEGGVARVRKHLYDDDMRVVRALADSLVSEGVGWR